MPSEKKVIEKNKVGNLKLMSEKIWLLELVGVCVCVFHLASNVIYVLYNMNFGIMMIR